MKLLFMGTSPFAVAALEALSETEHEIVGVVTQPDRPKGRGYQLCPSPVKETALSLGLRVETPETLKNEAILPLLEELRPDAIVVAAYGKILPPYVLDFPPKGCINIHGSLLPLYRGAAPINRVLIDGQTETGITTMYMDAGLDTGDIIETVTTPIEDSDDFQSLHDRMARLGGELIVHTLSLIEAGTAPRTPQTGETCYAAMIEKEDCLLDFTQPARVLFNRIRGLSPAPAAYAFLGGKQIKILSAAVVSQAPQGKPGEIVDRKRMIVRTGDGALELLTVRPEGKKEMAGRAFAAGNRLFAFDLPNSEKEENR